MGPARAGSIAITVCELDAQVGLRKGIHGRGEVHDHRASGREQDVPERDGRGMAQYRHRAAGSFLHGGVTGQETTGSNHRK
jgi:hypothetical protein